MSQTYLTFRCQVKISLTFVINLETQTTNPKPQDLQGLAGRPGSSQDPPAVSLYRDDISDKQTFIKTPTVTHIKVSCNMFPWKLEF